MDDMIYGFNFNGTPIPVSIKKQFDEFKKEDIGGVRYTVVLVGVCNSTEARDAMVVQGTNEIRRFHIEQRSIGGETWFGLYAYHVKREVSRG